MQQFTQEPLDSIDIGVAAESGSLVEIIVQLLNSDVEFSDIFITEGAPIQIKQPRRFINVDRPDVTRAELETLFAAIEPKWEEHIRPGAFDRAKDLTDCRIRANCFTKEAGKKFGTVIRRFPSEPRPLESLGLRPEAMAFAELQHGLVLIVGDTCQGKSTTLASMLDRINKSRTGHILTIEDPIETLIRSRQCVVTQREVDTDVESYYRGARDSLRQRADVVMIGEIRDAPTAREAIALSEAGPLVFATLHAKSPALAIQKMIRLMGTGENDGHSHPQALANSLRGILCQALMPSQATNQYVLATECLAVNGDVSKIIAKRDDAALRSYIDGGKDGCHSMNSSLNSLFNQKLISLDDARRASTDIVQFASWAKRA